jgi:hypothetical protein
MTLASSIFESLDHTRNFQSKKDILSPLSSKKKIDNNFFFSNQEHIKHCQDEHCSLIEAFPIPLTA